MSIRYSNSYGRRGLTTALARSLIVITFLNLNGFSYMLLGVNQVFSIALLFCSVTLAILHRRITLNIEFAWYMLLITSYILFGLLFIIVFEDSQAGVGDLPSLAGAVVLTLAIVQHIQSFKDYCELQAFFIFARNIALISAITTLFSPFLYPLFVNPPPSATYRSAGLFANPNEAGLIGTLAVALLMLYPIKARILNIVALSVVSAATIITFSRGAIMILLAILLASVFTSSGWKRLILVPAVVIVSMLFFLNVSDIINWLESQSIFEFDRQQLSRLVAVMLIFDGQFDVETAGARNELFAFAFNKALSVFPFGTGLNSFQAMEGGFRGGFGQWLGAHNSFLMIWGEAGVLSLLSVIGFLLAVIISSARRGYLEQGLFLLLVFLGCAMFSHAVFSLRFINVVTAFMIAQSWASYRLPPVVPPSSNCLPRRIL